MPIKEASRIKQLPGDKLGLPRVLIIGKGRELDGLILRLGSFSCSVAGESESAWADQLIAEKSPDIVLLEIETNSATNRELSRRIKQRQSLPIIAMLSQNALDSFDSDPNIDDFIVQPYHADELGLRIKRLLKTSGDRTGELVRAGDMTIDLAKYEVSVDDRKVLLTFKEYELLRFLASNQGRVFTRETLLNKVWGFDYFGGDRTVDVHIRRLRSKIEDSRHTFIETVRSIGYRFKGDI